MKLKDNNLEFAFSGKEFTNIGEDSNPLIDSSSFSLMLKGVRKTRDETGADGIVISLTATNMKSAEVWLCYSMLLNDEEDYTDDFFQILPKQEQELEILIEYYDMAYSNNRRVQLFFALEDGRRRTIGRGKLVHVDYNIFSGRYKYQKFDINITQPKKSFGNTRELDIRINKVATKRFFSDDWTYVYFRYTMPIIISNHTNRHRAFLIEALEMDGMVPKEIIGINDLHDAIHVSDWSSRELNVVIPGSDICDEAQIYFNFVDLASNNRYVNAFTYSDESHICKIDYSLVFLHNKFDMIDLET